jgi:tRNA nucleotidyltransferase (CCA-adding enzyme)
MNLSAKFKKDIPADIQKILELCSVAAEKFGIKIFIVGGIVRDILINKPSFDTDITVEGDAVEFANFLASSFPDNCSIKSIHEDFKTAKLIFKIDTNNIELDLASTRTEYYKESAALPTLKQAGVPLSEDISRRDFTINSMAMSLNSNNFGDLLDYAGGYDDLKKQTLKILHPESFIDDPTRIIRGLKFRVRFQCKPDLQMQKLQEECLQSGIFDGLCGERIKSELKQTLNLNNPEVFELFIKENIFRLINPEIKKQNMPEPAKIAQIIDENILEIKNKNFIWLIYLCIMLGDLDLPQISQTISKINISGIETGVILDYKDILQNLAKIKGDVSRFEIFDFFEKYSNEAIVALQASCNDYEIVQKTNLFFKELQNISIHSTGKTLVNLGFLPGPTFGDILRDIQKNKINGNISTEEDEISFLKQLISKSNLN